MFKFKVIASARPNNKQPAKEKVKTFHNSLSEKRRKDLGEIGNNIKSISNREKTRCKDMWKEHIDFFNEVVYHDSIKHHHSTSEVELVAQPIDNPADSNNDDYFTE